MMNSYTIITPEDVSISFVHVTKERVAEILEGKNISLIPEGMPVIDLMRRKAYILPDGNVLEIAFPGIGQGLLYNSKEDYVKAHRSEEYFASSKIIQKGNLHYCFNLEKPGKFLDKSIKKLDEYPEFERFSVYLLPQGRICSIANLTEDRYQGNWYSDRENFEYFYKMATDTSTGPPTKKR